MNEPGILGKRHSTTSAAMTPQEATALNQRAATAGCPQPQPEKPDSIDELARELDAVEEFAKSVKLRVTEFAERLVGVEELSENKPVAPAPSEPLNHSLLFETRMGLTRIGRCLGLIETEIKRIEGANV